MSGDLWEDPAIQRFLAHGNAVTRPQLLESAYTMGLWSGGEPDARQALELGFTIMLGKPLILAVTAGAKVPEGLARAADEVVEVTYGAFGLDQKSKDALAAAIGRVVGDEEEQG